MEKKIKRSILALCTAALMSMVFSCNENKDMTPSLPQENIIEVGLDPEFKISEPGKDINSKTTATEVILNRVWARVAREANATGTIHFEIFRASDNRLMARSGKIDVSRLVVNTGVCNGPSGLAGFNLSGVTKILEAHDLYRIEIRCSSPVSTAGDHKGRIWWMHRNTSYIPCSTYRTPTSPVLKQCAIDFSFKTENRNSDGTTYIDQNHDGNGCPRSINITTASGEPYIFGEEYLPLGIF